MSRPADERLIVALDVADVAAAEAVVEELSGLVSFYKIGYRLGFNGGLDLAASLARAGKKVFVDFKLLDIDSTVERGVERIGALGAAMTTVHAYPHVMRAAARGAAGSGLLVLGVTVLTSLDASDLAAIGYREDPAALVRRRARDAREAGIGGLVSSPAEAAGVRAIVGPGLAIVTPGIRPAGGAPGDQKRVATPAAALAAGATHLVVGRPILEAPDRRAAALAILAEMAGTNAAG